MTRRARFAALVTLLLVTAGLLVFAPAVQARRSSQYEKNVLMKEHILLLQGFVERWMDDNGGLCPRDADVTATGDLDAPLWPTNPWTLAPLETGTDWGDFEYEVATDRFSYTLAGHLAGGAVFVVEGASPGVDTAAKDELTIQGVTAIGHGIELWALDNMDVYPDPDEVAPWGSVGMLVEPWPRNPYTGQPMRIGTGRGDFGYTMSYVGGDYTLAANLADGETYDVGGWTQSLYAPLHRLRVSLKDMCTQAYAQVLKDYVDKWSLAHGGTLPTVGQMDPYGALAEDQTWWPVNPWTLAPMAPGTSTGEYVYTPGEDGAFTLMVHQAPLPAWQGIPGTEYPPTYTAQ